MVSHNPVQIHPKSTEINQSPLPDDKISQKSVQIHEIMMNAVGGIRTWARTCAITCTDDCTNKRRKKLARRRICSIWTVVLQCQGDSSQDFITPQEFVWQIHILILYGRSTYNFVRGIHIQILYGRFTYKFCMANLKCEHCQTRARELQMVRWAISFSYRSRW